MSQERKSLGLPFWVELCFALAIALILAVTFKVVRG